MDPLIRPLTTISVAFPSIVGDTTLKTVLVEGIYAGGDTVTGPATVVKAMSAGKRAAISIDKYIYGFKK